MKHAQIQKRLALLALGLLSEAQAREAAAHAEGCPACRDELARLRAADQALASAETDTVAVDLTERVLRRLTTRPAPTPLWKAWVPLAAGAAVLAAVLLVPWSRGPEPLSTSEVMQAYSEDFTALSLWGTTATAETEEPTWGFPTELAAWINSN
jgi:anti-sigma factor RsiW